MGSGTLRKRMSYTLYEVWAEFLDGRQELIETTASNTEALKIAKQCLADGYEEVIIFQETEDGESREVQRLTA